MGILVFDVGTSSMRGVLMNEQADILCQFQKKYHPDFHLSIYVTQNPEIWRSVLYDIAKNIQIWCEEHGHKVEMISLTAQRTSMIPVDRDGNALCDAVMRSKYYTTSRKIVTNINSIHSSGRLEENTHIQQTKTKFTIIAEEDSPYERTLHLIPKVITVGIGCKKNTPAGRIEEKVLAALAAAGISPKAVRQAASIDLKAQEPGILQLVEKYGWQYRTFSAEELETAEGEFTPSPFVKKITGIDNVCERSAVLAGGRLIKKKKAADGVTVALAAADWRAVF